VTPAISKVLGFGLLGAIVIYLWIREHRTVALAVRQSPRLPLLCVGAAFPMYGVEVASFAFFCT
jgi:hypothetical protein